MGQVLIITKKGITLRIGDDQLPIRRRAGKGMKAINLDDGDSVVAAVNTDDLTPLNIFTTQGKVITFQASEVRIMGRGSRGVRAIMLNEGDEIAEVV